MQITSCPKKWHKADVINKRAIAFKIVLPLDGSRGEKLRLAGAAGGGMLRKC